MKLTDFFKRQKDLHRPNEYALIPYLINDGKKHPFAICTGP